MTEPRAGEATDADPGWEVGADGTSLRYWLAVEGMRQAELRLAAQTASIEAMESRATSILTWSVTIALALAAAILDPRYRIPATAALVPALLAAGCCTMALWPRAWDAAGHRLSDMTRRDYGTELEHREAIGSGLDAAAEENHRRLMRFARRLKGAWCMLILTPLAAGAAVWAVLP